MDRMSPNKSSKNSSSSSSGCSASSSTTDIKNSCKTQSRENKKPGVRSRSFLHCLSKHLGRHFIQHHPHHHTVHQNGQTIVYNSHEELGSSCTDSFSLSYERTSRLDGLIQHNSTSSATGTSSFDFSSDERTSRASSSSAYSHFSPKQDDLDNVTNKNYSISMGDTKNHHIYISSTIYRPCSSLDFHDDLEEDYCKSDSSNLSSDESEENDQENIYNHNVNQSQSKSSPASVGNTSSSNLATSSAKGLHLSRVSITSSVRSIFQHISSVSASSTRSLSCSSTPLKRVWDTKCKKSSSSPANTKKSAKTSKSSSSQHSSGSSSSSSNSSSSNKNSKKEQQSILRPPMSYVYMKGMSGLYSRVPRYSICCPNGAHQWA